MKKKKIPISDKDFKKHLKEQFDFLLRSAKSYDEGYSSEAKRIATTLRVLLHNTKSSESLLTHLGKRRIKFYNGAEDYDSGLAPKVKLVSLNLRGEGTHINDAHYKAQLDNWPPSGNKIKKTEFLQWWNQIVIDDLKGNRFSRRDLVLAVANQDGGAHVDPELDAAYADLTKFNSLGWTLISNNCEKPFSIGAELATIRQICHEVLKTLEDEFPELTYEISDTNSIKWELKKF
jgi:hypothetical protein